MNNDEKKPTEGKCDQCDRNSKYLYMAYRPEYVDNEDLGPSGVSSRYAPICVRCAIDFGLTEPAPSESEKLEFYFREFFGRIGEDVICTIFKTFGYSVHSFGYERLLGSVVEVLSKRNTDSAKKLRSIPDFVVIGNKEDETFLVEVKATTRDSKEFLLSKTSADLYDKHWPEALLVVYEVNDNKIWCNQIKNFYFSHRIKNSNEESNLISIDLVDCAFPIEELFDFDRTKFDSTMIKIKEKLKDYGQ